MTPDVFISHSSENQSLADAICHTLEEHRIKCWISPRDVQPGIPYAREIMRGLKESEIMVLLFTRDANESEHVANELEMAFNDKKIIIPFLAENVPMNEEYEYYLKRKHWLTAYPNPEDSFSELVAAVKKSLHRNTDASVADTSRPAETKPEPPKTRDRLFTVGGVSFKMVYVEGGTFTMGATSEQGGDADGDEKPAHRVTLLPYLIGETPVTQALWQAVMGTNPSAFKGDEQRPVEKVSWDDCQEFIQKLNRLTGVNFRLPTEAQWEYAARGGNKSRGYKYAGSDNIGEVAWYDKNSYDKGQSHPDYGIHPVATKRPNELGLYDMSGNVLEWCHDWYDDYSADAQTEPVGPVTGSVRVGRGGGWNGSAEDCRVSYRYYSTPGNRYSILGFRLVLFSFI